MSRKRQSVKTRKTYKEKASPKGSAVAQAGAQEGLTPVQRIRADLRALRERISYGLLLKNIPYVAFLALLAVIYIANGHRAVETQRQVNKQQQVLKELRWRYMDAKTRLMNATMESKMIVSGASIGLKPLTLPAYSITLDEQTKH
jgi:hypothetical protein